MTLEEIQQLNRGDGVLVGTRNSFYTLTLVDPCGRIATARGSGRYFCAKPMRVKIISPIIQGFHLLLDRLDGRPALRTSSIRSIDVNPEL